MENLGLGLTLMAIGMVTVFAIYSFCHIAYCHQLEQCAH